jgi:PAS domain S-box-containing protein
MTSFPNSLIAEASRAISLYAAHQRVLEAMAIRLPISQVLTRLVQSIEDAIPGSFGSVVLLDDSGTRMQVGAAPALPEAFKRGLHNVEIGPRVGTCGTALFRRERVIVEDIESDPLWDNYRHLARPYGLRACWCTPIISSDGNALGSFAVYYKSVRAPSPTEMSLVDDVVDLACVAIGQERAESSLRRSEAHYRAVVETAPSAIVGLNGDQTVTEWNQVAEQLMGRSRADVVGKHFGSCCLSPDARVTFDKCFHASQSHGEASACETEITRPDGSTRWVLWNMSLVVDKTSGLHAGELLAIAQDITARREAEAALRQSEQQLRHSQKMEAVGRLAGGIAHDFNNLLTVIHGNTTLALQDAEKGSAQESALREVRDASTRATALTRQLLTFSRREPVEPRLLDVNVIVADMRRMLGRLIGEHIQLDTALTTKNVTIKADRTNIEQLLLNLAVNARDAMPDGGLVTIATEHVSLDEEEAAQRELPAGAYVKLSVSDNGTGMDEATRARAFEPFFTTKPSGEGTGLGLATVYAIAERHEGAVAIETQPGVGTTVSFWLPFVQGIAFSARSSGEHAMAAGSGTVLIVEDEEAVRHLARRVLIANGYRVLEASNGEEALVVWQKHSEDIDVLVTDVVMPKLGGQALVDRLRATRPDLSVVFCSGYSDNMLMPVREDDPHTAFLAKPFTLHGLVERVARLAANSPRRSTHHPKRT